jgi:hypothetical protein
MSTTDALPVVAHQIVSNGATARFVVCDDVADEVASQLRQWGHNGVYVHKLCTVESARAALAAQAEVKTGYAKKIESLIAERDALRAERDALKADAAALDWIECRAMNGQIHAARSIMGTGYEIAVIERGGPMTVTVELGTLRQALASRAASTGGKA